MIAYKGFAPDFTASFGSGKKQYHVGDVLEEDSSKTARTGMHCAEPEMVSAGKREPVLSGRSQREHR